MKIVKMSVSALALLLGIGGSAFTPKQHVMPTQLYYWFNTAGTMYTGFENTVATEEGRLHSITPSKTFNTVELGGVNVEAGFTPDDVSGSPVTPIDPSMPDIDIYSH
jgi:hypothetical protein